MSPVSRRQLLQAPLAALLLGNSAGAIAKEGDPARVRQARARVEDTLKGRFAAVSVPWPPSQILLRAFKRESLLELWGAVSDGSFRRVHTWPICATSGVLGPKRRQGDGQVPEGVYRITVFNPYSSYHLSLGLDYPNASDRILSDRNAPGGDIFIHGECVTIGCIPLGNEGIEEVYLAALEAHRSGGLHPKVHLFPAVMNGAGMAFLADEAKGDATLLAFWKSLEPLWRVFQETHRIPTVTISKQGIYRVG